MDPARLRSIPLFAGLEKRQRELLASWTDEVDLPAGRDLISQGELAYEFIFIESGTAEVVQDGRHLRDLGPGDYVGEIGLLTQGRRTASVRTTSHTRAAVMTAANFRAMVREMPSVADRVRHAMDERLGQAPPAAHPAGGDGIAGLEFATVADLAPYLLSEGIRARALHGDRVTISVVELDAGVHMPEHRHHHEQAGVVVRGELTFRIEGGSRRRVPGEMWVIPGGVPHGVDVGPDGCTVVEIWSPPRQDWSALPRKDPAASPWPGQ